MAIAISFLFFLAILGIMGGLVIWQIRRTDPSRVDTSVRDDITTAQEFLPFRNISDSMIDLGNHQYRAVIEVSSINYNLKTEKEKDVLEISFSRFLNSLDFPYSIFIETVNMDNRKILSSLQEDIEETLKEFPQLEEYATIHMQDMTNLHERVNTTKHKKKYIIVPYDEASLFTNMNDNEKYQEAAKELYNRCMMIIDGLESMGLHGRVLTTQELISLITSVYHRQDYTHADGVIDGSFLETVVDGPNKLSDMFPEGKLDLILIEARNKLESELYEDGTTPPHVIDATKKAIYEIEQIRNRLAGFYKSNVSLEHDKGDDSA